MQPHAAAAALAFGLRHCVEAVEAAAGALHTAEEPHSFWATVLSGQGQVGAALNCMPLSCQFFCLTMG